MIIDFLSVSYPVTSGTQFVPVPYNTHRVQFFFSLKEDFSTNKVNKDIEEMRCERDGGKRNRRKRKTLG